LSELLRWFEKRRETKALSTIRRHLSLTTGIVEDLESTINAAINNREKEMLESIKRVVNGEKEADVLRRKFMDEISRGELSSISREDLMHLVKRMDMVADWSREATRIIGALPMEQVPKSIKDEFADMIGSAKKCAISLHKCVNTIITDPNEALQAADAVEREEEKVDDIHEKARMLLGKEDLPKAGIAVLISELFDAVEMIADSCEDTCDQVRVIMIRK
jgi:predicted phosphate transport protein (TIGR00153 family)